MLIKRMKTSTPEGRDRSAIELFQVSALSNGQTMHVAVTFLETFFHRFTPQVAPNMMV